MEEDKLNKMVVIEFSEEETDWVIAIDKETAIEYYKKEIGLTDSCLENYKITELDEETLSNQYLIK